MNKFLDISEYNNVLDYRALANAGLKGVIIKASEGVTFTDSTFQMKYEQLKDNNINVGFYHFLVVTSLPESQAEHFHNLIKDKQMQIVPILDVESIALKQDAEEYCNRFMERFKELSGLDMIVYSGRCFIEEHFTCKFIINNKWWVADYSENKPIFAIEIVAWQYTDCCKDYPAISGGVDCSILYDEESFYLKNNKGRIDVNVNALYPAGNDISILQTELEKQGFRDENGERLKIDGIAGKLTLSACPIVKYGANGNITRWIQNRFGLYEDGIFGIDTKACVLTYQVENGLKADGIVGLYTWAKLLGIEV